MIQHNRQNSNQWLNFDPMKSKSMNMGPQCNMDRGGFRNNPMIMPDSLNSGPGGPPPGMAPRLPMWNQQVIIFNTYNWEFYRFRARYNRCLFH